MWRFSTIMAMALMLALSGTVAAGSDEAASPSKAASVGGLLISPHTASGEIVSMTPGKSVRIKESTGKLRTYSFSKKTKINGELKVGQQVSISSNGRWIQQITPQPVPAKMAPAGEPTAKK